LWITFTSTPIFFARTTKSVCVVALKIPSKLN
jgi:hypothetical protein